MGFTDLNIRTETPLPPENAPEDYVQLTTRAERLSVNFRFNKNNDLDSKALRDIDRVVDAIKNKYSGKNVLLFGFTDDKGSYTENVKLAEERAKFIEAKLATHGVDTSVVLGFGPELPVSSNDTEFGRAKNRRVEVWFR